MWPPSEELPENGPPATDCHLARSVPLTVRAKTDTVPAAFGMGYGGSGQPAVAGQLGRGGERGAGDRLVVAVQLPVGADRVHRDGVAGGGDRGRAGDDVAAQAAALGDRFAHRGLPDGLHRAASGPGVDRDRAVGHLDGRRGAGQVAAAGQLLRALEAAARAGLVVGEEVPVGADRVHRDRALVGGDRDRARGGVPAEVGGPGDRAAGRGLPDGLHGPAGRAGVDRDRAVGGLDGRRDAGQVAGAGELLRAAEAAARAGLVVGEQVPAADHIVGDRATVGDERGLPGLTGAGGSTFTSR